MDEEYQFILNCRIPAWAEDVQLIQALQWATAYNEVEGEAGQAGRGKAERGTGETGGIWNSPDLTS